MLERYLSIDFTEIELKNILQALHETEQSLRTYVGWIDDRPMLPAREVALEQVRQQSLAMTRLRIKIYEAMGR